MVQIRKFRHRRGFTMIEMLVVVTIILLLMSISIGVLRNAIGAARQNQTKATIQKVSGLLQQRMDAFYRGIERSNLTQASDKMRRDWYGTYGFVPPNKAIDVMVKKDLFRTRFPQTFAEVDSTNYANPPRVTGLTGMTYVQAKHKPETEGAALMYWLLTNSEVYGIAPVDESEFTSAEVRDTDGDGLMEFVDGWGRPLRFYRCPTHLFRPGDGSSIPPGVNSSGVYSTPDRTYVSAVWSGLPAIPTVAGELDPLARDPDDPTGQLLGPFANPQLPNAYPSAAQALQSIQNLYGTPGTYHAFLILSAGPDGKPGLLEPTNEGAAGVAYNASTLGVMTGQGRLGALVSHAAIQNNPINDDITNRQR